MQKKYSSEKISLSIGDLQNFTYFGNWIIKNFGDDGILLKDIEPKNVEFALDELIKSSEFVNKNKEDRGLFISAINAIIPNLREMSNLKDAKKNK